MAKVANVVLPGALFFEMSGTFTNGGHRVQRVNEVIPPPAGTTTDGQIVVDIMNRMGIPQSEYTPDDGCHIGATFPLTSSQRTVECASCKKQNARGLSHLARL